MQLVTRNLRIYFGAVGLLALWVGAWGYFIPTKVDEAIPWLVPPLHARFLGAMYLSGTAFMIASIFSRRYVEVKIMVPIIAIWTGMLFIVSLFYLDEFDYSRPQVWIWFGAYLIYPAIALWVAWNHRNLNEIGSGSLIPAWMKKYLLIQGILVTLLSFLLLFVPGIMVNLWPWKITPLLAQIYSAPFLSYGIGSLLISRLQMWDEVRVVLIGTFVFAFGVLIASLIHRDLFSFANISAWVWFGGFIVASSVLGFMTMQSARDGSVKSL